ncbi:MAG: hypothetical protein WD512_08885 [Candidatus Paceibacterota bacterium]
MKKKASIILTVLILVSGAFYVGSNTKATFSWDTEVINNANSEIGKAGYDKKNEIIENADIASEMAAILDPKLEAEKAELQDLLDQYYQMKLDNLSESAEFKEIEARIEIIKQNIYNRYTAEIDLLFEE